MAPAEELFDTASGPLSLGPVFIEEICNKNASKAVL
jgi:hypothetical protein